LAPGAKIYLVLAPNDGDLLQAVNYTINNLPVQIISISWGSPELDYSSFSISYYNSIFQSAYSKGINVFVATGDMGAYNGFSTPNVNFPASSPYVISVGGTVLSVSDDSYASETAWSDSGGGFSEYFSRPSFQPDLGSYREVPDVAFNAGTTVCAFVNGSWRGFIGTSLAAPSWAALDAILDQKLGGTSQLLPTLYSIYNNYGNLAFHQITSGCNGYYCANGGYSLVTGLGSPIANALVQILSKSSDTLTFSSNIPIKFNLNGINYTTPISINLSYGQKVTLTAYNFSFANTKYSFSSFSGQITSNNNTLTFFVNSSMSIVIDYVTEYAVREKLMNSTKIFWVENGSTIDLNLPLQYNSSGILGTLLGFSMDDGPLIHQDHFSSVVYAPINISAVFAIYNSTKIVFTGAPFGASAMVRYGIYTPLSASISETERTVYNGDTIYYAGSVISIFPLPTYVNNTRYVAYNFTGYPGMEKVIQFYAEKPSSLAFVSLDGKKILP
ncbi:MAG: S53 family peptidase, partial [Nanoarchaeota archaeon]|nr:S53 family peptidase [Nanoarchaeota archaeon]